MEIWMKATVAIGLLVYWAWIFLGKVRPKFSTWMTLGIASSVSLYTHNLVSARTDLINGLSLTITLGALTAMILGYKRHNLKFDSFDRWCVSACLSLVIIFLVFRHEVIFNICFQLVMVVAYFPTFGKIWRERNNSESFMAWGISEGVTLWGSYTAINKDFLALLYSGRASIVTMIILVLMVRVVIKNKKGGRF